MTEEERDRKRRVKKRLESYCTLKLEQEQLKQKIEELAAVMTDPRIQELDLLQVSEKKSDSPGSLIVQNETLQNRYKQKILQIAAAQGEIENMIEVLDPTERRLARYRYLDGLTWREVCTAINYSWSQVHRIHGDLLNKLAGIKEEQ